MMNFLMSAAANPITPIVVLSGVAIMIFVEAWKGSHKSMMGDIFAEGVDE